MSALSINQNPSSVPVIATRAEVDAYLQSASTNQKFTVRKIEHPEEADRKLTKLMGSAIATRNLPLIKSLVELEVNIDKAVTDYKKRRMRLDASIERRLASRENSRWFK